MTDANTTDSTPTPTENPQPNPAPDSNGSTTENPQPNPAPAPADGDQPAEGGTILTGTPDEGGSDKDGSAAGEGGEGDGEPNAFIGAPEGDYELVGLPEGTEIDKDALAAVTPVAKEIGLSNEGLSKIAAVYAEKVLPHVADQLNDTLQRDIAATHAQWANEAVELVKTDEVFGGKQLSEVQQVSAKAIDRFAGPEFRTFLEETGLGNHPAMLKFAFLAGSAISEDTTFERGGPAAKPKSRTEKYYGSTT